MPFFPTAYDTTVGRIFATKSIREPLLKAIVTTDLRYSNLGIESSGKTPVIFLRSLYDEELYIGSFSHPMLVTDFKKNNYLVTDLRMFKPHNADQMVSDVEFERNVRNRADFILAKTRTRLNQLWLEEGNIPSIRANYDFAGNVMAAWFSSALTKAFALDYGDQLIITAATIYYYRLLFTKDKVLEGDALDTAVVHTIKTTKMAAKDVYSLFERIGPIGSIVDFCDELAKLVDNVRLQHLNWPTLWNLIQNSWFGINSKDILAVAVEHPPTWIPLVFSIMHEKAYRSSSLYKLIDAVARRGNSDTFLRNMQDLITDQVMVLESIQNDVEDKALIIPDFE